MICTVCGHDENYHSVSLNNGGLVMVQCAVVIGMSNNAFQDIEICGCRNFEVEYGQERLV